jgi:diaminopimelate epimerase
MRIFNVDGSESDACGNGLRCMVKYYSESKLPDLERQEISVETMAGVRKAGISGSGGTITGIKTGMGAPVFGKSDIPVETGEGEGDFVDIKSMITCSITVNGMELSLNLLSMGNPHAVYFHQGTIIDFPLSSIGPAVARNKIFPAGVNFEVARVISRGIIEARVWERGVGETLACGSGACAITVAARIHGYIDDMVDIQMPGGMLEVEWDGADEVYLSGPAEIIFTGEWPE